MGGVYTEASKIRNASTFLKENALQWWSNILMQGKAPLTWVEFKRAFAANWLLSTFEVEVMTQWHNLSSDGCKDLEDALLLVESYKMVPSKEQVEKYCCGLPIELRDYCIKTKVSNMP